MLNKSEQRIHLDGVLREKKNIKKRESCSSSKDRDFL